uniref:ABC transporter family G domain-containing protein n=1 Tax=Ananas comosus var. bracteatus TaxID=296719 RepID=A0A6V7PWR6_ANACO|nr:unnamed protein product [Ananas comosus var. bracteatus]
METESQLRVPWWLTVQARRSSSHVPQISSVVTTFVHQRSRRVLVLVDRLLILSHGRTAYCGDPRRLVDFLAAFGRPVPVGESLAEFALDTARSSSPARRCRSSSSTPPPLRDMIAASISQGKLVPSRGR